jgi:hypothetical protein
MRVVGVVGVSLITGAKSKCQLKLGVLGVESRADGGGTAYNKTTNNPVSN